MTGKKETSSKHYVISIQHRRWKLSTRDEWSNRLENLFTDQGVVCSILKVEKALSIDLFAPNNLGKQCSLIRLKLLNLLVPKLHLNMNKI